MECYQFKNTAEYVKAATQAIEDFILEKLKEKKIVRVALSGGNSPIPVYRALAESKKIPWSRVALFLADERYVPLNSEDSNYKMINDVLASQVKNLRKFYHYNTRDPIATIVDQYQKMLQQFARPHRNGTFGRESLLFDLVVLGLGADGHTASLFPNDPALQENSRLVAHAMAPDANTQDRMTLTFPAIMDSQKIIFLIQGKDKKETVDRLVGQKETVDELPAQKILEHLDVEIFYAP